MTKLQTSSEPTKQATRFISSFVWFPCHCRWQFLPKKTYSGWPWRARVCHVLLFRNQPTKKPIMFARGFVDVCCAKIPTPLLKPKVVIITKLSFSCFPSELLSIHPISQRLSVAAASDSTPTGRHSRICTTILGKCENQDTKNVTSGSMEAHHLGNVGLFWFASLVYVVFSYILDRCWNGLAS